MLRIRNFAAGFVSALVVAVVVFATQSTGDAAKKSTAPARGYYLTTGLFTGAEALSACAAGYHMASLWEIHEPSNLRYETSIGQSEPDDGAGPPSTVYYGWVRTGSFSSGGNAPPLSNCDLWTVNNNTAYGSAVGLGGYPWSEPATSISPWVAQAYTCDTRISVWCVQD